MKKVAIIGPAHPLRGGLSTYNMILATEFKKQGYDCRIYTFSLQYPSFLFPGTTQYSDDPPPENLHIEVCINSINPFNWFSSAKKIRAWKPDLVIFRYWLPFMGPCLGTIARILKYRSHRRIIAITDNVIPHEKRPGDRLFTRYFINGCDGFLSMSRAVLNDLKAFSNKPAVYHPHPLYNSFGPEMSREDALKQLQLDPAYRYILFFGFIRKYKGLDLLLKAFADPRLRALPIKLIIAGEFYTDGQEYEDIIANYDLEESLVRHHHFIPDKQVNAYFCASDLVAQTYHHATQSGVTQIAYYYGIPMLVTRVGGLAELVPNEKVGYVTEIDVEEISNKLFDFFSNHRFDEFNKNISLERSKFSWENLIESITNVVL